MKHVLATVTYDPEAPDEQEMQVAIPEYATRFLSILTDFELKVVAAEAGLRVRQALEMPPSPEPLRKERCSRCGNEVSDWVDPDWASGRICRTCETKFKPPEK